MTRRERSMLCVNRLLPLAALAALLGLAAGCARQLPVAKRARVSGRVTLEGKALATGTITFDPETGETPAVLDILDGNYEGKAPVGKNRVRLSSLHKVSMREKMKMDGPGYDTAVEENRLPPRYNSASQIFREVEDVDNTFNFPLQTK